jgi:hypothetical protein
VLKIAWELAAGEAVLTSTVWPSVPEVHAVGLACGLLFGLLTSQLTKRNSGQLWLEIG